MLGPHGWGSEEQQPYPNLDMWQWQREPIMDYVVAQASKDDSDKHVDFYVRYVVIVINTVGLFCCPFWASGPIPLHNVLASFSSKWVDCAWWHVHPLFVF